METASNLIQDPLGKVLFIFVTAVAIYFYKQSSDKTNALIQSFRSDLKSTGEGFKSDVNDAKKDFKDEMTLVKREIGLFKESMRQEMAETSSKVQELYCQVEISKNKLSSVNGNYKDRLAAIEESIQEHSRKIDEFDGKNGEFEEVFMAGKKILKKHRSELDEIRTKLKKTS